MQNLTGQQWEEEEWTFYLKKKNIYPQFLNMVLHVLKAAVFLPFWSLSIRRRQFGNVFARSEYSGSSWTTFLYIYSTHWMDLLCVCRCAVCPPRLLPRIRSVWAVPEARLLLCVLSRKKNFFFVFFVCFVHIFHSVVKSEIRVASFFFFYYEAALKSVCKQTGGRRQSPSR